MPAPLVSVILPVYNQEHSVARAIESILRQRVEFQYEIIIGDDASADATLEICRGYEREHGCIRVIANNANMGLPANYYNLARLARGKYIADLAGDDEWCDTAKLQMQAQLLEANPEVTIVHTDWVKVDCLSGAVTPCDSQGSLSHLRQPRMSGSALFLPLLCHHSGPIIHSCTMMYRRQALESAMRRWPQLFFAPDLVCEDFQLITSLATLGDVAFIPRVTLRYSVDARSITGTRDYGRLCRFYTGSLRLTRDIQRIHHVSDKDMAPCYGRMVPYIIDLAFKAHDRSLMRSALQAASGLPLPAVSRIKAFFTCLPCVSRTPRWGNDRCSR